MGDETEISCRKSLSEGRGAEKKEGLVVFRREGLGDCGNRPNGQKGLTPGGPVKGTEDTQAFDKKKKTRKKETISQTQNNKKGGIEIWAYDWAIGRGEESMGRGWGKEYRRCARRRTWVRPAISTP